MEKKIKARKDHNCDVCDEEVIKKGDFYLFGSIRAAKYDGYDNQIGIDYNSWRICLECEKGLKEDEI